MPRKNLSALKRVRQAEKRRLRNQSWKSRIKTFTKKVEMAILEKDREALQTHLREAIRTISKAASKGVIHRNTASRRISRLMKKANRVLKEETA